MGTVALLHNLNNTGDADNMRCPYLGDCCEDCCVCEVDNGEDEREGHQGQDQ